MKSHCLSILLGIKAVLSIDTDMAAHQGREETQSSLIDRIAIFPQSLQAGLEMDRVPDYDRGEQEIESGSRIELVLIGAVADSPLPPKEEFRAKALSASPLLSPSKTRRRRSSLRKYSAK
jgi:hypothetical protein